MLQKEFLRRNRRSFEATQRKEKLDRFMNGLALFALGMATCLFAVALDEHRKAANFNYEQCDYMVAAGNLGTAPIPSDRDWNEITLTPGGNWCIATDLND